MVWGLSLQTSAPFSPHPSQAFPLLHVWFPLDLCLRDCELPKCIHYSVTRDEFLLMLYFLSIGHTFLFLCVSSSFCWNWIFETNIKAILDFNFFFPWRLLLQFYLPLCSGISLGMIYDIFLLLGLWLLMSLISVFVYLGFFVLFFNILVFVFSLASLKSLLCLHWSDVSWIEVVLNHLKPVSLLFSADKCICLWAGSVQSLCHFQVCSGFHSLLGPFGFPVHTCWASGSARHM